MVLNLDQSQAVNELERRGLKANISRTEESDEYEIGKVMSQDPEQNTKVERGSVVNLVISGGREVEVPDLRNMTLSQAEESLKEIGLRLGRTNSQSSDSVDRDLIISQDPRANTKLQSGTEIDVTVSTGPDQRVKTIEVPNLIGKTEEQAKSIINQYGLSLRDINYEKSSNTQQGLVMSQSIAKGTQVASNSKIDLTVSLGAEESQQETTQTTDDNDLRNVELRVKLPEEKDNFNVMVFDVVNGQRSQAIINQQMSSADLNEEGTLILNVKAKVGTQLEVIIDDETLGVYDVSNAG